jgi:predicted nucleic acid-binding protein
MQQLVEQSARKVCSRAVVSSALDISGEQTVAFAEQAGAAHLYTEDLNSGQTIVGVKIVNPLVAA